MDLSSLSLEVKPNKKSEVKMAKKEAKSPYHANAKQDKMDVTTRTKWDRLVNRS